MGIARVRHRRGSGRGAASAGRRAPPYGHAVRRCRGGPGTRKGPPPAPG